MSNETPRPKQVPTHVINRIAGEVPADPDTVRKVIAGKPVRGGVYFRICDALKRAGIAYPAPVEPAA